MFLQAFDDDEDVDDIEEYTEEHEIQRSMIEDDIKEHERELYRLIHIE